MITKKNSIVKKPEFGVQFEYQEQNKKGLVYVRRLSSKDILQVIGFWGDDRLINKEQFNDVCTTWCDQNIA